ENSIPSRPLLARDGPDTAITFFVRKNPLRNPPTSSIWGAPVRKVTPLTIVFGCFLAASFNAAPTSCAPVRASNSGASDASAHSFTFKDANGKAVSVPLVGKQEKLKL